MAEDDGSRRPPQAYDTVSQAGVGTNTTNQVSPGTVQEILDTGDQDLIDQAFDQMGIDDLTTYLQSFPSPSLPDGVGSQASRTPSTEGAHTPHRGSPPLSSSGARSPPSWGSARLLAAAGAGGGGDDGSGGSGDSRRRSTPRGRLGRGRRPRRPQPSPSLPWTPPSRSQQATPPRTLGQADLQRRLRMMLQDQEQLAQGREIANVTMTNSIVTSYKQGGPPTVESTSSRFSS